MRVLGVALRRRVYSKEESAVAWTIRASATVPGAFRYQHDAPLRGQT
jgi:hypothetical protein